MCRWAHQDVMFIKVQRKWDMSAPNSVDVDQVLHYSFWWLADKQEKKNSTTKGQEDMSESPDRDLSGATGTGTPPRNPHWKSQSSKGWKTNPEPGAKTNQQKKKLSFLRKSLGIDSGQLKHPKVNCTKLHRQHPSTTVQPQLLKLRYINEQTGLKRARKQPSGMRDERLLSLRAAFSER